MREAPTLCRQKRATLPTPNLERLVRNVPCAVADHEEGDEAAG